MVSLLTFKFIVSSLGLGTTNNVYETSFGEFNPERLNSLYSCRVENGVEYHPEGVCKGGDACAL
jgi:hypothetical protein